MPYLGIDQSLTSPGFALVTPGTNVPVLRWHLRTGQLRGGERLNEIYYYLDTMLKDRGPVVLAALEGYSIESQNRPFDLGEVGGIVRLCLTQHKVKYLVVSPKSLKKFVTGKGDADKEKMRWATKKKWSIDIDQNDECDAYGLAKVAQTYDLRDTVNRAELEVLHTLSEDQEPGFSLTAFNHRGISI
jgi:crossover junction endodeoxyribonuclease RuvC